MVGMFIDNKQQDASPHWCINTPSTDKTESKRDSKGLHSVVNTQHQLYWSEVVYTVQEGEYGRVMRQELQTQ